MHLNSSVGQHTGDDLQTGFERIYAYFTIIFLFLDYDFSRDPKSS
jgi:hypothetical protein